MKDRIVIPEIECQTCHYIIDSTSGAFEDAWPRKGDLTVCMKCGTPSLFDENLNMIPLSPQELDEIEVTDREAFVQLRKVQAVIDKRNKKN
jgi:hypothetical protein